MDRPYDLNISTREILGIIEKVALSRLDSGQLLIAQKASLQSSMQKVQTGEAIFVPKITNHDCNPYGSIHSNIVDSIPFKPNYINIVSTENQL